jgi:uncharacterized protein DUF4232
VLTPVRAGALVALAILAAACNSGSKDASKSTSTAAAPSSSKSAAGTSSGPALASTVPASTPPSSLASTAVSSSASASAPVVMARIAVELTRSHRTLGGGAGTADVDELSVVGLSNGATISAVLQTPVTAELADYTKEVASQQPCTGPACGSGDFQATFTTSRADSVVVSGTWTISTFFPGGAHPTTQLLGVMVDATTGASIAASQLFVGSSLKTLAAITTTAATAKLDAIGCNVDEEQAEVADGTAPTADNYAGTALAPAGLLIGLSQGQVAAEACGTVDIAVAWSAVQSQLSSIGARIAGSDPVVGLAFFGSSATPAADSPRCHTAALQVDVGTPTQVATEQYRVPIVFTNASDQPCSLLGFPGADFGAAGVQPVSMVRTPDKPARIILATGGQAHANLTYLAGPDPTCDAGGPWTPSTLTITPPDETTSVQIPWPGDSVDDCQAGATHPGSYIGPIVAG